MTQAGEFDCANPKCDRYHALVERRVVPDRRPPCPACGRVLRLVRVFRKMDEATKAALRDARERKEAMA